MSSSETERGRAVGVAAWAAASAALSLVVVVAAGGSATAGLLEPGPPKEASELLREMRDHLDEAAAMRPSRPQKRAIRAAASAKHQFVILMFIDGPGQSLFGCGSRDSSSIFFRLENVDLSAEMASRGSAKDRGELLDDAANSGAEAADLVATCPGADEAERAIARDTANQADSLARDIANQADSLAKSHKAGDLSHGELKAGIAKLAGAKRRLLAGQTIYDCDAFGIYDLVKDIDLRLLQALEESPDRRQLLIDLASRPARELIELWKRAPCDTECGDDRDNDGDGSIDSSDFGCRTGPYATYDRGDQSEQHHEVSSPNCSILANRETLNIFIGQPNAGSTMVGHILRNVTDGQVLIERTSSAPDFTFSNPVPIGAGVCGPGTSATAEWVREGLEMKWHLAVSKETAGVTPADKQIVAAADTR